MAHNKNPLLLAGDQVKPTNLAISIEKQSAGNNVH